MSAEKKDPNVIPYTELGRFKQYFTGEQRGFAAKYADPLTLNFKILFDFDSTVGLFAPETNINSALAYLKRIGGQEERYEMLKNWIEVFKIFVKDYDFLILEIEGLDKIQNSKAFEAFIEEEVFISITVRETSDMLIQGLLTTYRHIWFDDIRGVEVIPINLRRFDISVIVFSAGYFNMLYYDDNDEFENKTPNSNGIEKLMFPTLKKLDDRNFKNKSSEKYNHVMFNLQGCSINNEESGKSFTQSLTNEMSSDYIKNILAFNFRFGQYKGRFNNIVGNVDFVNILALMSAQNKAINMTNPRNLSFQEKLKEQFKNPLNSLKQSFTKESLNTAFSNLKSSTLSTLENKALNQIGQITSKNSVVGDLLSKMTPEFATQMIQNTINRGINTIEKKYIGDPIAKLNNMLFQNFSNDLIDIYKNNIAENKNIGLSTDIKPANRLSKSPTYQPEKIGENTPGISFGTGNVYNRRRF
jgi:hypothetical protein